MEKNYYKGWQAKNTFKRRKEYANPELYDIKYVDGEQINTYQFEDIQRKCNLCNRRRLSGLFYCQYPARVHEDKLEREQYVRKNSVCTLCANRMGI